MATAYPVAITMLGRIVPISFKGVWGLQQLLMMNTDANSPSGTKVKAGFPGRGGVLGHCVNIALWIDDEGVFLCISWKKIRVFIRLSRGYIISMRAHFPTLLWLLDRSSFFAKRRKNPTCFR